MNTNSNLIENDLVNIPIDVDEVAALMDVKSVATADEDDLLNPEPTNVHLLKYLKKNWCANGRQ